MDNRSKYFVFVPCCLLAQSFQAQGIVKYEWKSSIRPIVDLILDYNVNIIQMPCAESTFGESLIRKPKGLKGYDTLEFNEHCLKLAKNVYKQIEEISASGYKIVAILGIEQSPTCTVNYIYTNKGMEKRSGLFIEKLKTMIGEKDIPIIGINRKYVKKSCDTLKNLLESIDDQR